ncbi:MAG: PAS domain-containing protein [Methanoregulaceae archaeon]|jgi:two-component system CheB/CheR fusion protein|nr:PAS domain-containing protein [Methanoregulaceae archaeon]
MNNVADPERGGVSELKKSQGTKKTGGSPGSQLTGTRLEGGETPPTPDTWFPIIGIGASAGGLEALEQFLHAVPDGSGMAFIIVQHLDPDYKGFMPELLQRITRMPVQQVSDNMEVRPDCVYVIPPNRDLSLLHGNLYLLEPAKPRGMRLPIDFFFRSLAEDLQGKSVGVILSGMGSDGTLGLRAIKEKAGLVVVQNPESAKFDGMPRSAIDAGLADIIAPATELPEKIGQYLSRIHDVKPGGTSVDSTLKSSLDKIIILIRAHTGHDFSLYKKSTLYRRIERRMAIHMINRIAGYVRFLQENPREIDLLFKELLIGVTTFFRDPVVWERLKADVLPRLLLDSLDGRTLRAWVTGCSTGEEAYTLAMVFREAMDNLTPRKRLTLQIYATDLDRDAIDRARKGFYPDNIASDVSQDRLERFFTREEPGYRVSKEIREMVIFAPQNLIMDPPFTKLDLISCRNLLIYLEPEIQKKLLPLFHYSLNNGGILLLGTSESIGGFTTLFHVLDHDSRIFQRVQPVPGNVPVEFPTTFFPSLPEHTGEIKVPKPVTNLQSLADQVVLRQLSPAAVLVSDQGDIFYINGKTGKYLEPAAGKANWNIFVMARDGIRHELTSAINKAVRDKSPVTVKNLHVGTNGGVQYVDITVQPVDQPDMLRGMLMVAFLDVAPPHEHAGITGKEKTTPVKLRNARIAQLEEQLREVNEDLQTTQEEMQTSQEELKSTNEELQSTNEELQSTNEELTTSKEELQSLNEELQTVNAELQGRVDALSGVNNDLANLLNSTNIATVFLDEHLNIRRFTAQASKIFKMIPGDIGRPVTDITSDLVYPDMGHDLREVLRTLVFSEKVVPASGGKSFIVRIMPYRTLENRIEGIVITLADITNYRQLEQKMSDALSFAEAVITTVRDPLVVLDNTMTVLSANRSFLNKFRHEKDEVIGKNLSLINSGQLDTPELRELLDTVIGENRIFEDNIVEMDVPGTGRQKMVLNARQVESEGSRPPLILLTITELPL